MSSIVQSVISYLFPPPPPEPALELRLETAISTNTHDNARFEACFAECEKELSACNQSSLISTALLMESTFCSVVSKRHWKWDNSNSAILNFKQKWIALVEKKWLNSIASQFDALTKIKERDLWLIAAKLWVGDFVNGAESIRGLKGRAVQWDPIPALLAVYKQKIEEQHNEIGKRVLVDYNAVSQSERDFFYDHLVVEKSLAKIDKLFEAATARLLRGRTRDDLYVGAFNQYFKI